MVLGGVGGEERTEREKRQRERQRERKHALLYLNRHLGGLLEPARAGALRLFKNSSYLLRVFTFGCLWLQREEEKRREKNKGRGRVFFSIKSQTIESKPLMSQNRASRTSLLSPLLQDDCLTSMHGRSGRNAGHRGRRAAEPFAGAYDDAEDATASAVNFADVSSTLLPSLADRVSVPRGEQRWLRFDSRGSASYIDKIDKHALVTSLQLPARDLVMVRVF